MIKRQATVLLISIFCAFSSVAQEPEPLVDVEKHLDPTPDYQSYSQQIKEGLEKKGAIVGIRPLPETKLFFVEAEQGTYIVSADGRFVFDGVLKDVWHRKTLAQLSDLDGIDRVPLGANASKMSQLLATYTIGDPETQRAGAIFVDPLAKVTTQALQKIESIATEQHWLVILMPLVHGAPAVDRAKRIWCAVDQEKAKRDLIDGTTDSITDLRPECDDTRVTASEMVTNIYNIKELPHVIREDGLVSTGFPVEFDKWLQQP